MPDEFWESRKHETLSVQSKPGGTREKLRYYGQLSPGRAEEGLFQSPLIHIQVLWGIRTDRIPNLAEGELCLPALRRYIFPSPPMQPPIFHSSLPHWASQQHSSPPGDAWTSSN